MGPGPASDALAGLKARAEAGRDRDDWATYVAALRRAGLKNRARAVAKKAPLPARAKKALQALADGVSGPGVFPKTLSARLAAHLRAGRHATLRREARELLKNFPGAPEILNLIGLAALLDEDLIDAEIHLRQAVEADPASVDYLANLAYALIRQGSGADAVALLEPMVAAGQGSLAARINLASAYLRAGDLSKALDTAESALTEAPHDIDALGTWFGAALGLGQNDDAQTRLDALPEDLRARLLDIELDLLDISEGRATALRHLTEARDLSADTRERVVTKLMAWGEFEPARDLIREGLEEGGSVLGYRNLGMVSTWQPGDPILARLEREAADTSASPGRRAALLLALAKARGDIGDPEGSFAATLQAKGIWAEAIRYDPEAEWRMMTERLEQWTPDVVARLQNGGPHDVRPVFIIGLPRSGSTLTEVILSRHPQVRALGEHHAAVAAAARATPDETGISRLRDDLLPHFAPSAPGERVTDKLLANHRHVGPLYAAFPEARFLVMDRDPRATGLSILENALAPADHPYSLSPERVGRHAVNVARMIDTWRDRWPEAVRDVSYEGLVSDPDTAIPALVGLLGLDWDDAVLDPDNTSRRIDTLSVAQARRPISQASVARWRVHENGLKPMIDILEKAGLVPAKRGLTDTHVPPISPTSAGD